MNILYLYLLMAIAACLTAWKAAEFLRDLIFKTDVEEYLIRNGRMVPEKDWAFSYKSKGKQRFFLLKRRASTFDVNYDVVQRVGKRDKIIVVERAKGEFIPVSSVWMVHKLGEPGSEPTPTEVSPEQIRANFPLMPPEAKEFLYDKADEAAKGGFFPMTPKGIMDNPIILGGLIGIALILFAGVTVVVEHKYLLKYDGEYARSIFAASAQNAGREAAIAMIKEWNSTGKIPELIETTGQPPDVLQTIQRSVGIN